MFVSIKVLCFMRYCDKFFNHCIFLVAATPSLPTTTLMPKKCIRSTKNCKNHSFPVLCHPINRKSVAHRLNFLSVTDPKDFSQLSYLQSQIKGDGPYFPLPQVSYFPLLRGPYFPQYFGTRGPYFLQYF